jgi:hypothetical protein
MELECLIDPEGCSAHMEYKQSSIAPHSSLLPLDGPNPMLLAKSNVTATEKPLIVSSVEHKSTQWLTEFTRMYMDYLIFNSSDRILWVEDSAFEQGWQWMMWYARVRSSHSVQCVDLTRTRLLPGFLARTKVYTNQDIPYPHLYQLPLNRAQTSSQVIRGNSFAHWMFECADTTINEFEWFKSNQSTTSNTLDSNLFQLVVITPSQWKNIQQFFPNTKHHLVAMESTTTASSLELQVWQESAKRFYFNRHRPIKYTCQTVMVPWSKGQWVQRKSSGELEAIHSIHHLSKKALYAIRKKNTVVVAVAKIERIENDLHIYIHLPVQQPLDLDRESYLFEISLRSFEKGE